MSEKIKSEAVSLSDIELDKVTGGKYTFQKDGYVYKCDFRVSNFDTLYYVSPPNGGCYKFHSRESNPRHCCSHCDHYHKDPISKPGDGNKTAVDTL